MLAAAGPLFFNISNWHISLAARFAGMVGSSDC
jgi:hypothetical protein